MKIEVIKHITIHNFADGTCTRTSTSSKTYYPDNRAFTIGELIEALKHMQECNGDVCIEAISKIEVCEQVDDLGKFCSHYARFLPVEQTESKKNG